MAEILIMARDLSGDPSHPRVGDVIEARPDGWIWGAAELGDPALWTLVKLPGVTLAEASTLTVPGLAGPDSGLIAPARYFGLDLAKLPADPSAATFADVLAARFEREPLPDPNVIGTDRRVIG